MMPRELMDLTVERMREARKAEKQPDEQLVMFLRFLEGPGQRLKMFKGQDFLLRYLQESVKAAEVAEDRFKRTAVKSAETEEEEEAQANRKDRTYEQRREFVVRQVNKALCDWSEDDWKKLDAAYQTYLKRLKFL